MFGRKKDRAAGDAPSSSQAEGASTEGLTRPIRTVGLDREAGRERPAGSEDTVAVPVARAGDDEAGHGAEPVHEPEREYVGASHGVGGGDVTAPVAPRGPAFGAAPVPASAGIDRGAGPTTDEPAPRTEQLSPDERARRARSGRAVDDRPDPRKPSVWRAARAAAKEFGRDQCTDLAAALTYYAVLSVFPAALALLSLLGLFAQPQRFVDRIVEVLQPLVSERTLDTIQRTLESMASSDAAGVALVVGVVVALFSASAYVGAFGRAMNRILEVEEGRPVWKLRPAQILVTLVTVLLTAAALIVLVVSGPVARSVGDVLGLQDTAVTVWGYAKWPVLALIVIAVVGVLYRSTPNAKQQFRWLSPGAFVAIVVWLVASLAFASYVALVPTYDRTFGTVAGFVVALLWLWLTNLALLFGAELDSELERNRQLQAGLLAEASLQLPLRDDRTIRKRAAKYEKVVSEHREVRESFLGGGQVEDRPYR